MRSSFRLHLLGAYRQDGEPTTPSRLGDKPRVLLARLLLEPRPVSRESMLTFLWPESCEDRARGSLRQALHAIRRVLGPSAIRATRHAITVESPPMTDVITFLEAVRTGDDRRAVLSYGGPLLQDVMLADASDAELWRELERRRLSRLFESAAERVLASEPPALSPFEQVEVAQRMRDAFAESVRAWHVLFEAFARAEMPSALHFERAALAARIGTGQIDDRDAANALWQRDPAQSARSHHALALPANGASGATASLVGRGGETEWLRALWDRAARGTGMGVMIGGRAGVGKSALLTSLDAHLRAQPVSVVCACATRSMLDAPLALLRLVVATLAHCPGAQGLTQASAAALATLTRPRDPRALVHGATSSGAEVHQSAPPDALVPALTELLRRVAGEMPCALLLDDLHWSDLESRQLIRGACADLDDTSVLVVGTSRLPLPEEWRDWPAVRLEPLPPAESLALLETLAPNTPDPIRDEILRLAGGVPLLMQHAVHLRQELSLLSPEPRASAPRQLAAVAARDGGVIGARVRLALETVPAAAALLALLTVRDAPMSVTELAATMRAAPDAVWATVARLSAIARVHEKDDVVIAHNSVADALLRLIPQEAQNTAALTLAERYDARRDVEIGGAAGHQRS